jgi:hypothetical protein
MYKCETSGMQTHLLTCDKYDGNTQVMQANKRRKTNAQGQLVRTFVCAELPFRFVENEEFRKLLNDISEDILF